MDETSSALQITVPEQKLTTLSFCEANPKQMEQWVSNLPMANIGETAKRLYHAVMELNQLILAPSVRFQLVEVLRGPVYYVCKELSKHFLNHSIVLPEKQRKIANLAQALQLHLANGYKSVIHDQLSQGANDRAIKNLAPACHRAISDLARCVVRSYQLYCQSPPNVWLEIHQIYKFAHDHGIENIKVRDKELSYNDETTVQHTYKRIVLLGCSKPNQMRQNDISTIYEAYDAWADNTFLDYGENSSGLFLINPHSDSPPYYRSLHSGAPLADGMGFDTALLVDKLTDYIAYLNHHKRPPEDVLDMPVRVADNVMGSLSKALGILTKRTFKRLSSNGRIFLTVGLSSTHYFCAGNVDFNALLMRQDGEDHDANYYLHRAQKSDIWSSSFDSGPSGISRTSAEMSPISFTGASGAPTNDNKRNYSQHIVPLINTSPGGYCIQWSGDVPGNVQAGELLGLREQENQPWSIGVIRWIRQVKQHGTQFGVELLAPNAKPCGVQLTQKTGDNSEFLRGLLLPELPSIGQPATLITPRLPFQVGHKVILNKKGRESKVQLSRRVSSTGSFSQFEIKFLSQAMQQVQSEVKASQASEDDFDSLWPTL
ncbi:GTPase [Hahella sp. CCB-MM4]|uniref:GTPase n=1 Tax=Hahella sp. (strain CCB-MM4) TaxID=1926491 RepID=UPI000B9BAE54|nr:GTPase [Hahella sp. CCB-MM4]OZG71537.1 GTPase [Hahella sp. CCB-MM4]